MALIAAKCTQCGADIEVDETKEGGVCKNCGTPFITEKVISYITNNNITNNSYAGANVTIKQSTGDVDGYLRIAKKELSEGNYNAGVLRNALNNIIIASPDGEKRIIELFQEMGLYDKINAKEDIKPHSYMQYYDKCNAIMDLLRRYDKPNPMLHEAEDRFDTISNINRMCSVLGYEFVDKIIENLPHEEDINIYRQCIHDNMKDWIIYCWSVGSILNIPWLMDLLTRVNIITIEKNDVDLYEAICSTAEALVSYMNTFGYSEEKTSALNALLNKLPEEKSNEIKSEIIKKKKGCYIATCVYGSYDCPEVWTLRRFRDYTLDNYFLGRLFIKMYYSISPLAVRTFGNTAWFKYIWKIGLDRLVSGLNKNGVPNTAYKDKD